MRILFFTFFCLWVGLVSAEDYTLGIYCQDLNMTLQRTQIHKLNIANITTTRTLSGGPYQRKILKNCRNGLCEVIEEEQSPILIYNPDHPDANQNGYVATPSFNVMEEMDFLVKAQRAYEVIVENAPFMTKDMLVGDKLTDCFKKYKYFKEAFDLKSYLGR